MTSGRRATPMTIVVTAFVRPRRLSSATRLDAMAIDGGLTLDPTPAGTRLRWEWDLEPKGTLALITPVVRWLGVRQERRIWTALKRYVEDPARHTDPERTTRSPSDTIDALGDAEPMPLAVASWGVARCFARTLLMLAHSEIHLPRGDVGRAIRFADGTSSRVYRETSIDEAPDTERCTLGVCFRLRGVRGWGHRAFELESLLNTPLFVGFPGFVSKLWLAHDDHDVYRGIYEWDGPVLADRYARCLWRVLALVSMPGSIHYVVLPHVRRDDLLANPSSVVQWAPAEVPAWARVTQTASAPTR
jgi:hypothetical protein